MHEFMEVADSPDRMMKVLKPRILTYGLSPPDSNTDEKKSPPSGCSSNGSLHTNLNVSPRKQPTCSPPYRKVRALRLFDTPTTPKTILQKSSLGKHSNGLPTTMTEKFDQQKSALTKRFASSSDSCAIATHHLLQPDRPIISMHVHNKALDNVYPAANVNPFSPNSLSLSKKRPRTQSGLNNSMPDILMRTTNQSMRTSTKQSSFNAATTTAVHSAAIYMNFPGDLLISNPSPALLIFKSNLTNSPDFL